MPFFSLRRKRVLLLEKLLTISPFLVKKPLLSATACLPGPVFPLPTPRHVYKKPLQNALFGVVCPICGEVTERPKVHDWKSCVLKGTEGSNPSLSANLFLDSHGDSKRSERSRGLKSGQDVHGSERRGVDAGTDRTSVTKWANPFLSAIFISDLIHQNCDCR